MNKLILQAIDPKGNIKTWEYFSIKSYLTRENHIYTDNDYKFHKAIVNGKELINDPNGQVGRLYFRDVSDFKTYCRCNIERKEIKMPIPKEILHRYLLEENIRKRERIYKYIQDGAKNVDAEYKNGSGGRCEYRPGYIDGYNHDGKNVEISWINDNADLCNGEVSRRALFNEIRELIDQGIYLPNQAEREPKTLIDDDKQLDGQMSIYDWLATS